MRKIQFNHEEISQALKLKKTARGYLGACPSCGYVSGFSMALKQDKLLLYCHAGGCSYKELKQALQNLNLYSNRGLIKQGSFSSKAVAPLSKNKGDISKLVSQLWEEAWPLEGTLGETYLRSRGLKPPYPSSLRFHSWLWHSPSKTYKPALLGRVEPWEESKLVALHRTYLEPEGHKYQGEGAKMILGQVKGAGIKLSSPNGVKLAIAEGIETGLTFQQETGVATWVALAAGGFKSVCLPHTIQKVYLCLDHDEVGINAGNALADRLTQQGFKVYLLLPPQAGQDLNDLLRATK